MTALRALPSGQRGLLIETAERDPAQIAAAIRTLAAGRGIRIVDVVPGACTVLVTVPIETDLSILRSLLAVLPDVPDAHPELAGPIELDVRYDGPDLADVARMSGLSVAEVIMLHSQPTYRAAFSGFAPGFAYLTGGDERLHLPRRASPRPGVPAGSVAIADIYTAVYPRRSPGGWHLLGTTNAELWDLRHEPPALITPSTVVRFNPIAGSSTVTAVRRKGWLGR
jgi:KipI family sensor histidine kinase inhibitor